MGALLLVDAARRVAERRKAVDAALRSLERSTREARGQTFREVIAAREALANLGIDLCALERALRAAESSAPPARVRIRVAGEEPRLEFVEVEDSATGRSVRLGQWVDLGDGYSALEFTAADVERAAGEVE